MKYNLLIILESDENRLELTPYDIDDDILITIYVKDMTSYDEIINNEEYFKRMKEEFELIYGFEDDYKQMLDNIGNLFGEIKYYLEHFDMVEIDGDVSNVKNYLDNNRIFKNKNILYNEILPLNRETYNEVESYLSERTNIRYLVEGNGEPITLEEYKKTVEKIEGIAQSIRNLNLSPLEEIMYVYDIVREREYLLEDESEDYSVSRDLTSVLFGDKIVCAGYTVYFNAILRFLGYKAMDFNLLPNESKNAHMRSLVYVEDEKYNVNGMYFFDPTFDSRKGDNSFLEKYRFFARTYEQMKDADKEKYVCEYYKYMDSEKVMELEEILDDGLSFTDLVRVIGISKLNKLFRMAGLEEVSLDNIDIMLMAMGNSLNKEKLFDRIYEITMLSNSTITYETFLGVLYNVRKQQYYANPEKYALDMDSITNILIKSKVADKPSCDEERLLTAILGSDFVVSRHNAKNKVLDYFQSNGLDKDMERIRFLRILKTTYDNRLNEEKRLTFKN